MSVRQNKWMDDALKLRHSFGIVQNQRAKVSTIYLSTPNRGGKDPSQRFDRGAFIEMMHTSVRIEDGNAQLT
jgi:hypothetical protein